METVDQRQDILGLARTAMKCIHCQGEMRRGTTPFHVDRKGCHLLLDAVPAWVCVQCGEPYFEGKEVDAIQDLVAFIEKKTEALALSA
jgi:YgiT-type zinc finger domain-containing protein